MEMCIAKPRMHSVCVVGWAGPGGGMDYYWLCPRNEKGTNDKIEEKKGSLDDSKSKAKTVAFIKPMLKAKGDKRNL